MASMTNYLKNKKVDHEFRGGSYTPPATYYVALFTTATTAAGGGTEVSGGSYARVAVAAGAANWQDTAGGTAATSTGTTGTTKNVGDINFPTATADWGTVTHAALFDAATAGNMLYHGPLAASQAIPASVQYKLPAAALAIQIDN